MPAHTIPIREEVLREILRPPIWDPLPPWLRFDEEMLNRFAALEVEFKIKELQLQQEMLQQFGEMIK